MSPHAAHRRLRRFRLRHRRPRPSATPSTKETFVKILAIVILLSGLAVAQCTQATIGTNCNSPMNVSGSTAAQSSVGLADNGATPPAPAPSQYWLSIDHGTIRLSANGQP